MELKITSNLGNVGNMIGISTQNNTNTVNKLSVATKVSKTEKTNNEVTSIKIGNRKGIVTGQELLSILENISAINSNIYDVDKAADMIEESNRNILDAREESILAQANQSKPVVQKLME